jgi:hypothetical protein
LFFLLWIRESVGGGHNPATCHALGEVGCKADVYPVVAKGHRVACLVECGPHVFVGVWQAGFCHKRLSSPETAYIRNLDGRLESSASRWHRAIG